MTIGDRESVSIPLTVSLPEPPAQATGAVTLFTNDLKYPEVNFSFRVDPSVTKPNAVAPRSER